MPRECWAVGLGDCAGGLSAEHIISQGVFSKDVITVRGPHWAGDGKAIGLANAKSKILCKAHNNALSPADSEARSFSRAIPRVLAPPGTERERHFIDGPLLEQWLLKTCINVAVHLDYSAHWQITNVPMRPPPAELVSAALGRGPLRRPMGLYAVRDGDETFRPREEFAFLPATLEGASGVIGWAVWFWGFRYWLHVSPTQVPGSLIIESESTPWSASTFTYHLPWMRFTARSKKLPDYIHVRWPNAAIAPRWAW